MEPYDSSEVRTCLLPALLCSFAMGLELATSGQLRARIDMFSLSKISVDLDEKALDPEICSLPYLPWLCMKMVGGSNMPTDSSSNQKGGRRSFSIFRRAGRRHNSNKYDDVPSESSGDDKSTFHNNGGKKITRPEPLLRSSSDRAYDDWMGAGHEPGSPEMSNNTKPLPAQSQASPVLNLFGGYKTGPSGTQQISTPEKASLYDPHRAKVRTIPRRGVLSTDKNCRRFAARMMAFKSTTAGLARATLPRLLETEHIHLTGQTAPSLMPHR